MSVNKKLLSPRRNVMSPLVSEKWDYSESNSKFFPKKQLSIEHRLRLEAAVLERLKIKAVLYRTNTVVEICFLTENVI